MRKLIWSRGGLSLAAGVVASLSLAWAKPELATIGNLAISGLVSLLSVALGFGRSVYKELEGRFVSRVADRTDKFVTAAISDFKNDYLSYVHSVHHDVDLKGLTTVGNYSLSVEQVFVDLSLAAEPLHLAKGSVVNPEAFRPPSSSADSTSMVERHPIWYFMQGMGDRGARLAIIGPPGAGKTTLMKHLVGTLATKRAPNSHKGHVPIFLYLREYADRIAADEKVSLADILRDSLIMLPSEEPDRWFEEQLTKGHCLVLLDGLDEVASREQRGKVVAWVDRQMVAYAQCTWIVTSRPQGYQSRPLDSATVLQVRPFTETQIHQFLQGWYLATQIRAAGRDDVGVRLRAERECADLLGRLQQSSALLDLGTNPLLLTMIAHVHFYRGALPGSRAELYKEMCQVLLGNRQEAKGLRLSLSMAQNNLIARTLAYRMMVDGVRDIRTKRAEQILRPVLRSVGTELSAELVLQEMEASSGLLLEKEAGKYAFAHLTLQEYLTAAHIRERQGVGSLLPHVDDEWWREVHLLYASQADATPLIEKCLTLGDPPHIHALALALDCLDLAVEVDPEVRTQLLAIVQRETIRGNSARRSSMLDVQFAREMRNWVRIAEDTYYSSRPLKLAECEHLLEHSPLIASSRSTIDGEALGIPFDQHEARTLVLAVNSILGSRWQYRLPRRHELQYAPRFVDAVLESDGLWVEEEGVIRVYGNRASAQVPELLRQITERLVSSQTAKHSALGTERNLTLLKELGDMLKHRRASSSLGIASYSVILTFKRKLDRMGPQAEYQTLAWTRGALSDAHTLLADLARTGFQKAYGSHVPIELLDSSRSSFEESALSGVPRHVACEALDYAVCYLALAWLECDLQERDISNKSSLARNEYMSPTRLDILRRVENPLLRALCGLIWLNASLSALSPRGGAVLLVRDAGTGKI